MSEQAASLSGGSFTKYKNNMSQLRATNQRTRNIDHHIP